jgi:hypothetical protein
MKKLLVIFGNTMKFMSLLTLAIFLITKIFKWESTWSNFFWVVVVSLFHVLGVWIGNQLIIYNRTEKEA